MASIRVHVQPGLFASERIATFVANGQHYEVLVDATVLDGDRLPVEVLDTAPGRVVVRLPGETLLAGRTISLPQEIIDAV